MEAEFKATKCAMCGEAKLEDKSTPWDTRVAGVTFTAELPAQVCNVCGESYVHILDAERFELQVSRALLAAGITKGGALKHIRKSLGLPATELAELLGVRGEAISRWENGVHVPDRAVLAVLAGLVEDMLAGRTDTRDRLVKLAHPEELQTRLSA